MTTPVVEDFDSLAKALKKLEEAKGAAVPKPAPAPDWAYVPDDFDPA